MSILHHFYDNKTDLWFFAEHFLRLQGVVDSGFVDGRSLDHIPRCRDQSHFFPFIGLITIDCVSGTVTVIVSKNKPPRARLTVSDQRCSNLLRRWQFYRRWNTWQGWSIWVRIHLSLRSTIVLLETVTTSKQVLEGPMRSRESKGGQFTLLRH